MARRLHVQVGWPDRPAGLPPVRVSSLRTVDLNAVMPATGSLYAVKMADGCARVGRGESL